MRRPPLNIDGQRFGLLLVLSSYIADCPQKYRMCVAKCDCGVVKAVDQYKLMRGEARSCGCAKGAHITASKTKHGMSKTRTYAIWRGVLARCSRESDRMFPHYGGRGIKVCERWLDFSNFLADMGECPAGLSIERRDNNGNYEPGNCEWATDLEQGRNKRTVFRYELDGESLTATEIEAKIGIPSRTLWLRRVRYGWPMEDWLLPIGARGHNRWT